MKGEEKEARDHLYSIHLTISPVRGEKYVVLDAFVIEAESEWLLAEHGDMGQAIVVHCGDDEDLDMVAIPTAYDLEVLARQLEGTHIHQGHPTSSGDGPGVSPELQDEDQDSSVHGSSSMHTSLKGIRGSSMKSYSDAGGEKSGPESDDDFGESQPPNDYETQSIDGLNTNKSEKVRNKVDAAGNPLKRALRKKERAIRMGQKRAALDNRPWYPKKEDYLKATYKLNLFHKGVAVVGEVDDMQDELDKILDAREVWAGGERREWEAAGVPPDRPLCIPLLSTLH